MEVKECVDLIVDRLKVNRKLTMERFCGDEELYLNCIRMFVNENNCDTLDRYMNSGDYKAAFKVAHSIKGVVGNLGFSELYAVSCKFVDTLRGEPKLEEAKVLYEDFKQSYAQMLTAVEELNK